VSRRTGRIITGLVLVLLGIWFLLANLGVEAFSFEKPRPLLIIPGVAMFPIGWLATPARDPRLAFVLGRR
jgi:hypothetical protein